MADWCDALVADMTGAQVAALRADWKLSVAQLALLLGVHHATVYRWEKRPKLQPIERYSRRVLAVLHLLRGAGAPQEQLRALMKKERDIDALHLLLTHAVEHQAVLLGESQVAAMPEAVWGPRRSVTRPLPMRLVLRGDVGEEDEEDEEDEESEGPVTPRPPATHGVEVFILGAWTHYGWHSAESAMGITKLHEKKGRKTRIVLREVAGET